MKFNQAQQQYIKKLIKKAKAEERAEIIKIITIGKISKKLIKEQNDCYDFDEASMYEIENEIREDILKELK
jgi:hypothetical protein